MKLSQLFEAKAVPEICRGINATVTVNLEQADRILNGEMDGKEIVSFLEDAGIWWYDMEKDGASMIEEAKEFAMKEDDLTQGFGKYCYDLLKKGESKTEEVELPIVLVAKKPKGWDYEKNPLQQGGLNGNSYIETSRWKSVQLLRVLYFSNKGWVEKPVSAKIKLE